MRTFYFVKFFDRSERRFTPSPADENLLCTGVLPASLSRVRHTSRAFLLVRLLFRGTNLAINHGYRRAPVALARDEPIAEAILNLSFSTRELRNFPARFFGIHPVEFTGIQKLSDPCPKFSRLSAGDDLNNRQPILFANSKSRSSCAGTAMIAPVP